MRRSRIASGSTKFRDAEALLIQRKQSIKEGKQPEIKRIANYAFKELADQYVEWAAKQRSFRSKYVLIQQLLQAFGNIPLRRFSSIWNKLRMGKGGRSQ